MNDPYEVLGITREADEAKIRSRYLELVRAYAPDRAPERFAAIRAAYDEVRDPLKRLEVQLFSVEPQDSVESLIADLRARIGQARVPMETLFKLAENS
jgi:curved DNA-binding protein CbpA